MQQINITPKQSGERLDKFLSGTLTGVTRSQIQKLIKQGGITINKKSTTPHYKLKNDDVINIETYSPVAKDELLKKNSPIPPLNILADTEDYIVIDKQVGLVVHGADHIRETTLVDVLLDKYPKIRKAGEDPDRPGIVHRLDKEVSGLLIVAKTQDFFDNLKQQWQKRTIDKEYTALVYGKITKDSDSINFPITRANSGHKMVAKPLIYKGRTIEQGKRAATEFKVIKRFVNYTLLKIKTKTGRTHQVRVHMTAYGHPIVGDDLYGTKKTREQNTRLRRLEKLNLGRILLVADKLSFVDLSGQKQSFKIELPKELKKFLKQV